MKKTIFSLIALVTIVTASFASNTNGIDKKILQKFFATYHNVSNLKWAETPNYVTASFVQDNIKTEVSFDYNCNLLETIRHLNTNATPRLNTSIYQNYKNAEILNVTEYINRLGKTYEVTIASKKRIYVIVTDYLGTIQSEKRIK